jgi:dihydrodipicolinate synthase/N-acetylneuraminate lyase
VELARAWREGRTEDAERLQGEIATLEEELHRDGTIPGLKRRVAERLGERGATYGTALRAPLGAAGRVGARR